MRTPGKVRVAVGSLAVLAALVVVGIWFHGRETEAPVFEPGPVSDDPPHAPPVESGPAPGPTRPETTGGSEAVGPVRQPGGPGGALAVVPDRAGAQDGEVIGWFRVEVRDEEGQPLPLVHVFWKYGRERRTMEWRGDLGTMTGRDGKAYLAVKCDRATLEGTWSLDLQAEREGFVAVTKRFSIDEVWGQVMAVELVLARGQTVDFVFQGIDPAHLDGKIKITAFGKTELGEGFLLALKVPLTAPELSISGLSRSRVRVEIRDDRARYAREHYDFEPPFPDTIPIVVTPLDGLGTLHVPSDSRVGVCLGRPEEKYVVVGFDVETGLEADPERKMRGENDTRDLRLGSGTLRSMGWRIAAGRYAIHLLPSVPIKKSPDEPRRPYGVRLVEVREGEETVTDWGDLPEGVEAEIDLVLPTGREEVSLNCDVYAPLVGTDRLVRLIARGWDQVRAGPLYLSGLPPGGRLIFCARDCWILKRVDIPETPGGSFEATVVLEEGGSYSGNLDERR